MHTRLCSSLMTRHAQYPHRHVGWGQLGAAAGLVILLLMFLAPADNATSLSTNTTTKAIFNSWALCMAARDEANTPVGCPFPFYCCGSPGSDGNRNPTTEGPLWMPNLCRQVAECHVTNALEQHVWYTPEYSSSSEDATDVFFRVPYYCYTVAAPRDWGRWSHALSACVTRVEVTGDCRISAENRPDAKHSRTTGRLALQQAVAPGFLFPPPIPVTIRRERVSFAYHRNAAILSPTAV